MVDWHYSGAAFFSPQLSSLDGEVLCSQGYVHHYRMGMWGTPRKTDRLLALCSCQCHLSTDPSPGTVVPLVFGFYAPIPGVDMLGLLRGPRPWPVRTPSHEAPPLSFWGLRPRHCPSVHLPSAKTTVLARSTPGEPPLLVHSLLFSCVLGVLCEGTSPTPRASPS